jgi:NADPH-dependent 7-cyano-7-deazaguanine reductase QueF-like protein
MSEFSRNTPLLTSKINLTCELIDSSVLENTLLFRSQNADIVHIGPTSLPWHGTDTLTFCDQVSWLTGVPCIKQLRAHC